MTSKKCARDIRTCAQKMIDAARETNRILWRTALLGSGKSLTGTAGDIRASTPSVASNIISETSDSLTVTASDVVVNPVCCS